MTKKDLFFYLDEKVCYLCHKLNPLHSYLFGYIKRLDKKTNKKKILILTRLLHIYNHTYHKTIHPALKSLHKKLKPNM